MIIIVTASSGAVILVSVIVVILVLIGWVKYRRRTAACCTQEECHGMGQLNFSYNLARQTHVHNNNIALETNPSYVANVSSSFNMIINRAYSITPTAHGSDRASRHVGQSSTSHVE